MTRYHIRDTGEPGLCRAMDGNCPYSPGSEHYSSKDEARKAYESAMEEKNQKFTSESIVEYHRKQFSKLDADVKAMSEKMTPRAQEDFGKNWSRAKYLLGSYYEKDTSYESRRGWALQIDECLQRMESSSRGLRPAYVSERLGKMKEEFHRESGPTPLY